MVADVLEDLLKQRDWKVVRDPLIGEGARADFMLLRNDGVALVAELTLEHGVIHFASLAQVASYRNQISPRGEGQYGFVLLTTGSATPEVAEIAYELQVRVITAGASAKSAEIATDFADQLDAFSHFAGRGPDKPRWALALPFNRASEEEIEELSHVVERQHYFEGQKIYEVGTQPTELYVVTGGKVLLTRWDGKQFDRYQLGVFGEMAVVDEQPRIVTAEAVTDVEVWTVPRDPFLELLRASRPVRESLHEVFSQIIRGIAADSDGGFEVLQAMAKAIRSDSERKQRRS